MMLQFSYPRHFAALAALSILTALCVRHAVMPAGVLAFALYGALHAAALVISVRRPVAWWRRVSLVALAAALSMLSFGAGLLVRSAAALAPGHGATYLALGCAAALGAASYGLALRYVLGVPVNGGALGWLVVGCVLATYLAAFSSRYLALGLWWLVVLWWFAFSGALWFCGSMRRRPEPSVH